jgi:thymidine kinase
VTPVPPADSATLLSVVPASGDRRRHPAPAHLRFFHGPMDCGKSTLALQVDHDQSRQGRRGLLLTQGDRSARPQISSRVGLCREALQVAAGTDLRLLVRDHWAAGHRVDYLIVDEAQFLTAAQVDQLAELVGESHVDVYAFGLTTDFRVRLFPGTQRLSRSPTTSSASRSRCSAGAACRGCSTPGWWTARWCARARRSSSPTSHPRRRRTTGTPTRTTRCSAGATTCSASWGRRRPVRASWRCAELGRTAGLGVLLPRCAHGGGVPGERPGLTRRGSPSVAIPPHAMIRDRFRGISPRTLSLVLLIPPSSG